MKSHSSRDTFDPQKHFSSVRMQQGRVQIDADSNEQIDIVNYRVNTEASDVIGLCGAPMGNAGFQIQARREEVFGEVFIMEEPWAAAKKNVAQAAASSGSLDFLIGAGRYYVDGILCQNEQPISYLDQDTLADLPAPDHLGKGFYVVYLDVWERLLTAIDDPSTREIALGGPDTATRAKTIWQVKCWRAIDDKENPVDKVNCLTTLAGFDKLIAPSSVRLAARTRREKASTDACLVSPTAGYMGLENQLYRIEIHDAGQAVDISEAGIVSASRVSGAKNQIVVNGAWKPGQALEIFSSKPGDNPMSGTLAHVIKVDSELLVKPKPVSSSKKEVKILAVESIPRRGRQTLTLDIDVSTLPELSVRQADATFKWSRDNGVVVTTVESINGQKVTVRDLGPDDTLGFKEGQWVEVIDDTLELRGLPGELGQITKVDSAIKEITLSFSPTLTISSDPKNPPRHPKLRRWDGVGAVKYNAKTPGDSFIDLESGVQVQFSEGQLRTGDYWTIPARTATADTQSGNIEWPQDAGKDPLPQLPFGITHHYCRLGIVQCSDRIEVVQDCRKIFPPITELTSLCYVGGGGQEAMPGHPQPQPLQVGVFNGSWPVSGAPVSFTASDGGQLTPDTSQLPGSTPKGTSSITVLTDGNGVASCAWTLDRKVTKPSQQVEARLLDANGDPTRPRVRFNGNLSIADQVFYDPGNCGTLQDQGTVQLALSRLSRLSSIYKISGDSQEIMPGENVLPLKVLVASPCGPVTDDKFLVTFRIVQPEKGGNEGLVLAEGGKQDKSSSSGVRGKDGFWTCTWTPDRALPFQEVEASVTGDGTTPPTSVRFSLNLSKADHVAYAPGDCSALKASDTVQKAIEQLSRLNSLYEVSGNNQEIMPGEKLLPLKVMVASPCGVSEKAEVTFAIASGKGTVGNSVPSVVTKRGVDGVWTCNWSPDATTPFQEVEASITGVGVAPPTSVRFSLNLSKADHVKYTPGDCNLLKASDTVQKAIDQLALAASLYEVSGNNQIVIPAKSVLGLTVLAANKCGPVREQKISFRVISGDGKVEPAEVVTKDDGMATTSWTIGPRNQRDQLNQQVEARFTDSKVPVAPPSSVLFNAYFSEAGNVLYDPNPRECPDLAEAKVTTVKAALDALCRRKTEDKPPEEGIHILAVKTGSGSLLNDTLVPVESLVDGVAIVCDQSLAPSIAYGNPDGKGSFPLVAPKPTCFLTLDLPSPFDIFGNSLGNGPGTFGFHPLILASYVRIVSGTNDKEIRLFPTTSAITWLRTLFGPNSALNKFTDRVLAHLTLKGNFIVSAPPAAEMWLDGEAFAIRNSNPLNLRYGGDGRRGGDFEMWFWLVQRLILQANGVAGGITGTVVDASGAGVKDVTVTVSMGTQFPPLTTKSDANGKFDLKLAKGVYRVNAKLGAEILPDREVIVT
jgi:hypothetical protein